ncbi:MAG: hypothetical protein OEM27_05455, partial [Nitrospinota bacterium]|nr:hypothetical protein [Nitrospinota bacterium]
MFIIGISCFYHDSAVALIENGNIVAAAQEERFTRKKHDRSFPVNSLRWCLEERGISLNDVSAVAFYDKPILTFDRLLETYLSFAPRGFSSFLKAMPVWLKDKLFQKDLILGHLEEIDAHFDAKKLLFSEHHYSHAASAFYASPFKEAVILTLDGVGEWATTTIGVGREKNISIEKEIHFPHSLGLLYSAFTYYLGFKVDSGEYKVMGLAPYGEPKYSNLIKEKLVTIQDDGSFWLDQSYFNYCTGLTMTNNKFAALFGNPVRDSEEPIEQFHMDMASSIQGVTEEIALKITRHCKGRYGIENLCMAGGVALNCVANGKILRDGAFKNIWIQPAAGDAGGALGAALLAYHHHFENDRQIQKPDLMEGSYLGPSFGQEDIMRRLRNIGAKFTTLETSHLIEKVSEDLANNNIVGWFQGRMEFGPRALGNRSILGNPMSSETQKTMNLKIKFRESFRPFAPAVIKDDVSKWFEMEADSPYMLLVADVQKSRHKTLSVGEKQNKGFQKLSVARSEIPAVTHVDYSARIQTVHEDTNPEFYRLIQSFKKKTNCGLLV